MDKRILDYPEAYELEEDDYLILESVNGGTCKILAKPLEPIHLVVTSIEAVYVQSGVVKDNDSLDILRPDLTVTAYYNDGSSEVVTDYDLSGSLEVGSSTITVTYKGKTDTFEVTVETSITYLYKWDFTQSLIDSVSGRTAELLNGATRDSSGITFDAISEQLYLGDITTPIGKTIEIDVANFDYQDTANIKFLMNSNVLSASDSNRKGTGALLYRFNYGWTVYGWNTRSATGTTSVQLRYSSQTYGSASYSDISGKTVKVIFVNEHKTQLYIDDILIGTVDDTYLNNFESPHLTGGLYIGGTNKSTDTCYNMTITGVRIYANQ